MIMGLFFFFFHTDLYDGFIEANKKEDATERMWAIRSMVSIVYMQSVFVLWDEVTVFVATRTYILQTAVKRRVFTRKSILAATRADFPRKILKENRRNNRWMNCKSPVAFIKSLNQSSIKSCLIPIFHMTPTEHISFPSLSLKTNTKQHF